MKIELLKGAGLCRSDCYEVTQSLHANHKTSSQETEESVVVSSRAPQTQYLKAYLDGWLQGELCSNSGR